MEKTDRVSIIIAFNAAVAKDDAVAIKDLLQQYPDPNKGPLDQSVLFINFQRAIDQGSREAVDLILRHSELLGLVGEDTLQMHANFKGKIPLLQDVLKGLKN